jgi:hypothetical protein
MWKVIKGVGIHHDLGAWALGKKSAIRHFDDVLLGSHFVLASTRVECLESFGLGWELGRLSERWVLATAIWRGVLILVYNCKTGI